VARDEQKRSFCGANLAPEAEAVARDVAQQLKIVAEASGSAVEAPGAAFLPC